MSNVIYDELLSNKSSAVHILIEQKLMLPPVRLSLWLGRMTYK